MLELRHGQYDLPQDTLETIRTIPKRTRGRRGGTHIKRKIPVYTSIRNTNNSVNHNFQNRRVDLSNLRYVPKENNSNNDSQKQGPYNFPSIYMCNPRSLNNKMDEFRTTVLANNFDMCTLSETWFVPDRSPDYFDIDGYTLYSNPRPTRGGGVAIYVRENMHSSLLQVIVPEDLEVIWLQARPERLPRSVSVLIFAAVYFPDPKKERELQEHIQDTLDILRAKHPDAGICILGDMNRLVDTNLCRNNGLSQIVTFPTRGDATLDKIITNFSAYYLPPQPFSPIGLSDHSAVSWFPNTNLAKRRNANITRTIRPMKDSGIREFGAWITQFDWSQVLETEGTIAKTDTFYEILQKGIDTHFPTREIKIHISDKPWMSSKTKDLIRRRQEVFDPSRPWLWRFYRNKV